LTATRDMVEKRERTLTLLLRIPVSLEHLSIRAKGASGMDRRRLHNDYRDTLMADAEVKTAHLTQRDRDQVYEIIQDPLCKPALRDWKDASDSRGSGHFEEAVEACRRGEVTQEQFGPKDAITYARPIASEKYPEEVGWVYVGIQLKNPDYIPRHYCEPSTTRKEMFNDEEYIRSSRLPRLPSGPSEPLPMEMSKEDACGQMKVGLDEHIYADKDAFFEQIATLIDISYKYHIGKYKGSNNKFIDGLMDLKKEVFGDDVIDIIRLLRPIETKYNARIEIQGGVNEDVHRITHIQWTFN
jgi:hypothetical protein